MMAEGVNPGAKTVLAYTNRRRTVLQIELALWTSSGTNLQQRIVLPLLALLLVTLPLSVTAQGVDWVQVNTDGFGDANNGGAPAMAAFNSS